MFPIGAFGVSISAHIRNEVVIGPRDNGFPGPDVALDGPADRHTPCNKERVTVTVQRACHTQEVGRPDLTLQSDL